MSSHSPSARAGDAMIVARAQRQVQTFFDELKNGTTNYRTVASLSGQIAQEYRGRCILELLQNAHDALATAAPGDPRRITFVLSKSPSPVLLIGNSGTPFRVADFEGICQLAQSPKDPNQSVGNKGLGFRSVLEVCSCPEIWSTAPSGCDTSFVLRFDPAVNSLLSDAAKQLEALGLDARSPFDPQRPLVDWSPEQLEQYRARTSQNGIDGAHEARAYLSPYQIPLPVTKAQPEVQKLLAEGHVTVIRLPLDGGRSGTADEAVRSVDQQLRGLDARSTVFLSHLESLVIDVVGQQRTLERLIDSDLELPGHKGTRHQRLLVGCSGPEPAANSTRQFQLWTRAVGGDNDPQQTQRIASATCHLPNRWPQLRRVSVGASVEDGDRPESGLFVIFLPTKMSTGTAANINAPFYGSLDRRQIDFEDPYNQLILEFVLDLCIDVATTLATTAPESWPARAVIDLVASTAKVSGRNWRLSRRLIERAMTRNRPLAEVALVLCDKGWCSPRNARVMPKVSEESPMPGEHWRENASFDVVADVLRGRQSAVEQLLRALGGSPNPTNDEWRQTIEQVAGTIQAEKIPVTWDAFLRSLITLPTDLLKPPKGGVADPLETVSFLPTRDGRLLSAAESTKLFFPPMRIADASDAIAQVPSALRPRIAFLHPDVRTQDERGHNTAVYNFLKDRFARGFRRGELLRVAVDAVPLLPAAHDSLEAQLCAELFFWTVTLLSKDDEDEPETLRSLLGQLPVACHGGWCAMKSAVFGPGWERPLGELVGQLADELPSPSAEQLRENVLLPPDDPRWRGAPQPHNDLLALGGVVEGLRLRTTPQRTFYSEGSEYQLPSVPPEHTPQVVWNRWLKVVGAEAKPQYISRFEYSLGRLQLLPVLHQLDTLSAPAKVALSRLTLTSLEHWPQGWEKAIITKNKGNASRIEVTSPLAHWLKSVPWLIDGQGIARPLSRRWFVSESMLANQQNRFAHLDPLSLEFSRELKGKPAVTAVLEQLGLNVYPTEKQRIGPKLLDSLAAAWADKRVPPRRFDVFLAQVRDAWRSLDPAQGIPNTLLVRTEERSFVTVKRDALAEVYLPDHQNRARALREHGKPVLEMRAAEANRIAPSLAKMNIRQASKLEERHVIDGVPWTGTGGGTSSLEESSYAWLAVVLLTIAAHGGHRPVGTATDAWRKAVRTLHQTQILECETIEVQLVEYEQIVASSEPDAQWLSNEVLALRRSVGLAYERLAPAAQAMLERQDLLKDIRLVLDALKDKKEPTTDEIEAALARAEIDAQSFADVRHHWAGNTSVLIDRIRPLAKLLDVSERGLDAAVDIELLTQWVSTNLPQWPAKEILLAARKSRDDRAMGTAAWRALGERAQLPAWNAALAGLGERYAPVENPNTRRQAEAHCEGATPLLRSFARHVANCESSPELFRRIDAITQGFTAPPDWSNRWWEVPFSVVIEMLRARYAELGPAVEPHLRLLNGVETIPDLRAAFTAAGIVTEPNPYETADRNRDRLRAMLSQIQDLYLTWGAGSNPTSISPIEPSEPQHDETAYLQSWSETQLFEKAISLLRDQAFVDACKGCSSPEEIRQRLGLDAQVVEARRAERQQQREEEARRRRTFEVAGISFEVGVDSYHELFEHLHENLACPEGPRVRNDDLTPLTDPPRGHTAAGRAGRNHKTSHRRPCPELRELVGVIGEMHAYRFLQASFGPDVVTRDAWVSEFRLTVLPLVEGEPDRTSDGYGYDFKFRHNSKVWHVEVKASQGSETRFELGITEIEAASRLVRHPEHPWRILRVVEALSDRPTIEWLPNPFEEGFRGYFRLREGGMIVSYARKRA